MAKWPLRMLQCGRRNCECSLRCARGFEQQQFGRYFLNGLVVAGSVVIASALIAFLAAATVARFRFRFPDPPADHVPGGRDGFRQILFPLVLFVLVRTTTRLRPRQSGEGPT
jgi:hypothetical protein